MKKRIIITGATGLIGKKIIALLIKNGYSIVVFTRNVRFAKDKIVNDDVEFVCWDYTKPIDDIIECIDGSYSIINLAGASIGGKRWNSEYKKVLFDSRILTTKKLIEAISKCINKPESLVNSSAIGYYGINGEEICNEESKPSNDFLAKLCIEWENEAMRADKMGIRTVVIRAGIVLDKNEGALNKLLTPFKFFLGSHQGNGKQWVSWIHIDDLVNLYLLSIENKNIKGALNGTAPEPVTNKTFCKAIGKVLKRPSYFPVPSFILKIAIGKFSKYLLTGKKVIPKKAIRNGYKFRFIEIENALSNLLK
jgi:uncharacterized protein